MPEKEYIDRKAIPLKKLIRTAQMFSDDIICAVGTNFMQNIAEAENKELFEIIKAIQTSPTADVAKVRHGTWEEHDRYVCNSDGEPVVKIGVVFICSECGRQEHQKEPYCHCGAKMDSDSNIESSAKVMLRLCGTEYKYCDGDCKHCNEPEYHATNSIQRDATNG